MTDCRIFETKSRFLDLYFVLILFALSFYLHYQRPSAIFGILVLVAFGYAAQATFLSIGTRSMTERVIIGIGCAILLENVLIATLLHLGEVQLFKPSLLVLFLLFLSMAMLKRFESREMALSTIELSELLPWIGALIFFSLSLLYRHAYIQMPDAYVYIIQIEQIVQKSQFIQIVTPFPFIKSKYFFLFTYSGLMEFAKLEFESVQIITLFFVSMSLVSTYMLANELFDKKIGYLSLLYLAINPSILYYSIRFLAWALNTFLLVSFTYFFYKWIKDSRRQDFLISLVFISSSILVKFQGVVFLFIAIVYLALVKRGTLKRNAGHLTALIGVLVIAAILMSIPTLLVEKIGVFLRTISQNYMELGHIMYITFFSPDIYSLPLVILAFFGAAMLVSEPSQKKFLLPLPVLIFFSLSFLNAFRGVRHLLVIMPFISIIAAYGTFFYRKYSGELLSTLVFFYLAALSIMAIYAPRFPHLAEIMPDIPLQIRAITFFIGGAVFFVKLFSSKREKLVQNAPYFIILLVIATSLLNANFFINGQSLFPDGKRTGIQEATEWILKNTPENSKIQSTTWENYRWEDLNMQAYPEMRYPRSTIFGYYLKYRVCYAPPRSDSDLLKRIEDKEVDYVVSFTDYVLTESDYANDFWYLRKYVNEAPTGTELVHTEADPTGEIWFKVYKVL